ncbi:hypothetical protein BJY16_006666 [Actinoplanes octamycinicus]|uniref:Uncharacterized protein n=1 Tax=Actinoplanes octamycinicus TaxID=135948 RepID=A0A7W7MAP5_9ACTN|nr:hypothetical protein [Actinoplanes octamycinicus]MBB4743207.1 hypothetical protein [Actinoplanes octamycinicus]GIE61229.1 hypothetical protein Aoc01nite_66310 [Actinoplanes octamycinicus]
MGEYEQRMRAQNEALKAHQDRANIIDDSRRNAAQQGGGGSGCLFLTLLLLSPLIIGFAAVVWVSLQK